MRASFAVDGDDITADFTIEFAGEGAPEGEHGPGQAEASRVAVDPMGEPVGSLDELFAFEEGTEGTEVATDVTEVATEGTEAADHHLPPRWHHRPPPSCQEVTGDPPRRPSRPERRARHRWSRNDRREPRSRS